MHEIPKKIPNALADGGDRPGFDCVLGAWRAHARELEGFLKRRLGEPSAAEDLLHEVFIRAMREGRGFCRLDNPRAWLFRVARNASIDHLRLRRPGEPLPESLPTPETDPEPLHDLQACLWRNLPRLAEPERDIIRACDLEGMRQAEYARARGLGLAAAKSRLLRARRKLRALLVERCDVRFDDAGRVCCHAANADACSMPTDSVDTGA